MFGELFDVPSQVIFGQLLVGLINGAFYALLSLGLAVIFGLLKIVNFAHGMQFALGAFAAWGIATWWGGSYWLALVLAPLAVGLAGIVIERLLIARIYKLDPMYGLLLTFGLALIVQGLLRQQFGTAGMPYNIPPELRGAQDLGFITLPNYRAWVPAASLAVCFTTWLLIEKTRLGSRLRAATENAALVGTFGINVPLIVTLTYGFGVALAALAGVLAAPIYSVHTNMGSEMIIIVFAVVVIGGMGSIPGAVASGFGLGLVEGLTRLVYPQGSTVAIFIIMALVLLFKPNGLFGKGA